MKNTHILHGGLKGLGKCGTSKGNKIMRVYKHTTLIYKIYIHTYISTLYILTSCTVG